MFTEDSEEFPVEGARYALPIRVQCSISHTHMYTYIHTCCNLQHCITHTQQRRIFLLLCYCLRQVLYRAGSVLPCNSLSFQKEGRKGSQLCGCCWWLLTPPLTFSQFEWTTQWKRTHHVSKISCMQDILCRRLRWTRGGDTKALLLHTNIQTGNVATATHSLHSTHTLPPHTPSNIGRCVVCVHLTYSANANASACVCLTPTILFLFFIFYLLPRLLVRSFTLEERRK